MSTRIYFTLVFVSLLVTAAVRAQDSLSLGDVSEMKFLAEKRIKDDFKDLLNNISAANTGQQETAEMINNSHSGQRDRIFWDVKVRVEDDINPAFHSSNNTRETNIRDYLKDFDLLYKKGDDVGVVFNDIKSSDVKKNGEFFVKVYFSCFFKSFNAQSDLKYMVNNRVAEIWLRKEDNKWNSYISRLGFYNPADTVNDIAFNVPVKYKLIDGEAGLDSAALAKKQLTLTEEIKAAKQRALIEEEEKTARQFTDMINEGDKALAINDFPNALKFYQQAKNLRPYDRLAQSKISSANKAREQASISNKDLYDQLITNAMLLEKSRDYDGAIKSYNDAIQRMPNMAETHSVHLKELNQKARTLYKLDQKYQTGNYKEAIKEYEAALKKDKKNSDYALGMAKCYEKLGETDKALKYYDMAFDNDDKNLDAIERRADLLKRQGKYIDALTDYNNYLNLNSLKPEVYVAMSELRLNLDNKNFNAALKDLDNGIDKTSKNPSALLYLRKGLLLVQKKEMEAASKNFSRALELEPANALAFYHRGKCQLELKNISNASKDFANARKSGLDTAGIMQIAQIAENYFYRSTSKFDAGGIDSAIVLIDYAIAVNPDDSKYSFFRGNYYYARHNYREGIRSFDEALRLNENYIEAYYQRGLCYYFLAEYGKSAEDFARTVKLEPKHFQAYKGQGDAHFAVKEYPAAISSYTESLRLINALKNNDNLNILVATINNSLGKSYIYQNDYPKAIEALKIAVKKNPSFADAFFNRGYSWYKTGEQSDAIADIGRAIALDNKHYDWYYYLGRAHQEKKEYSVAATYYSSCISLDSARTMADAFYLRGLCNYQLMKYEEALPDYKSVIALKKDTASGSFDYELGRIYLETGKYDSSIQCFTKYLQHETANAYGMYGLGTALFLSGKQDESITWLEKSFSSKGVSKNDVRKGKLADAIKNDKRLKDLYNKYY